ncbi:Gmad2 immunoglobulin-like domain-containing protein [Actinomycetes bacterium KLBMP 9759]
MAASGRWRISAAVLLAAVVAGCGAPPAAVPPPGRSGATSTAPTTSVGTERAVPVYYVADTKAGPRLYREFHRIVTADPASDAVREMFEPAIDRDYRTGWPAGSSLRTPVTSTNGMITVDLTGVGGMDPGSDAAALTVQQLVFTVQGALQSEDPVRLLVDGEPATADPIRRGDAYALRSPVQIDAPADGATVPSDVTVTGEAAVFEATVRWEVLRDGAVLRTGFTSAAEGMRFSAFSFPLNLGPGTYTVRVLEDDPSGGEGRPPLTDDRVVTVR